MFVVIDTKLNKRMQTQLFCTSTWLSTLSVFGVHISLFVSACFFFIKENVLFQTQHILSKKSLSFVPPGSSFYKWLYDFGDFLFSDLYAVLYLHSRVWAHSLNSDCVLIYIYISILIYTRTPNPEVFCLNICLITNIYWKA